MKKPGIFAASNCVTYPVLAFAAIATPAELSAQDYYAQIYSDNTDYVEVTVDTRGLQQGVKLSGVHAQVAYQVGERKASKTWPFTDTKLRSLEANKVYRRYLALNEGPEVQITGGRLDYTRGVGGEKADMPSYHKVLKLGPPPAEGVVVGPPPGGQGPAPGRLVKGSGPAVYLVEDGRRRWIPDMQTFNAMGFQWGNVHVIPDEALNAIPMGEPIPKH